jgi:hypothetical protein
MTVISAVSRDLEPKIGSYAARICHSDDIRFVSLPNIDIVLSNCVEPGLPYELQRVLYDVVFTKAQDSRFGIRAGLCLLVVAAPCHLHAAQFEKYAERAKLAARRVREWRFFGEVFPSCITQECTVVPIIEN